MHLPFIALFALFALLSTVAAPPCPPGTFYWVREGLEHCQSCQPGCACPGNYTACSGCSGGFFSLLSGAASCSACPPGTTTEIIYNSGCDPQNILTPCANAFGPLGFAGCHPVPPPARVAFAMPTGALYAPPQYQPGGPPFVPNVIPPYYDMNGQPMVQQSY